MAITKTKKYIISKGLDEFFIGIQSAWNFIGLFFREVFKRPFHPRELINQCFEVGLRSMALITVTGFIVDIYFKKK